MSKSKLIIETLSTERIPMATPFTLELEDGTRYFLERDENGDPGELTVTLVPGNPDRRRRFQTLAVIPHSGNVVKLRPGGPR